MAQTAAQVLRWDLFNRRRLAQDKLPEPPTIINASFILHTTVEMDYVKVAIEREIDAWRVRSFNNFLVTVRVDEPTTAGPVYGLANGVGAFVGYDTYHFEWRGTEESRTRTLTKTMEAKMLLNDSIKLHHNGRWSAVSDFLEGLKVSYEKVLPAGRTLLDVQCDWWKANGKSFRLMALTAELRDLIYHFGFGDRVEPYPTSKTRRLGGNIAALEAIKARKPTSGLLRLNRQVGAEARHILYLYTSFYIEHKGIFHRLMSNVPTRPLLRRLELALSHQDFQNIFGNAKSGDDKKDTSMAARVIPQLKLNRLELVFAPPPSIKDVPATTCQRSIVGLIIESAWPWVRGQPVRLSGFIKDRQKQVFEARCLVERKNFEMWRERNIAVGMPGGSMLEYHEWLRWEEKEEDGGVSLSGESKSVQNVVEPRAEQEVYNSPPRCICQPKCTQETWVADD